MAQIVRYLALPESRILLSIQLPLNVLVVIADPLDSGRLDVHAEWGKLQMALANLEQRGSVRLTRLEAAGLSVEGALTEARIAAFAHGRHLETQAEWGTPVLFMRTDDGHLFDL